MENLESELMNRDDVLFLEVFSESVKAECDKILKLVELCRAQFAYDPFYFNKKFFIATLLNNNCNNSDMLNDMKTQLVSDFHFIFIHFNLNLAIYLNIRIIWSNVEIIQNELRGHI